MDIAALQELLVPWDWEAGFDRRTLARGIEYYRADRVLTLQHAEDDGDDVLIGKVQGTRSSPYVCTIRIRRTHGAPELDAECTCPMGFRCKHAAAVLAKATATPDTAWSDGAATTPAQAAATRVPAHQPSVDALREWRQWLARLQAAPEADASRSAEPGRQFGLLVRAGPYGDPPNLQVNPVWLRPSRSKAAGQANRLVDPQPLQLDLRGPVPEPADGWPPDVAAALTILLHGQSEWAGQRWLDVTARFQETALLTLLERYPAYLERGSAPLTHGETLPLRWHWQDLPDGSQELTADVAADAGAQLLRAAHLWYLLPGSRRLGLVDADPAQVRALAHVPIASAEQAESLRTLLSQCQPALPLPATRAAPRPVTAAPTPILELHLLQPDDMRREPTSTPGFARLTHDYAGHRLGAGEAGATVRRFVDGQVFEIHRNASLEQRTSQLLVQLGFHAVDWYDLSFGRSQGRLKAGDWLLQPGRRQRSLPAGKWRPTIERLVGHGFRIEYGGDFPHTQLVRIDEWHAELTPSGSTWFDVDLGIDIGKERVDLLPILRQLIMDPAFPRAPARREKANATWRVKLDETRSAELPLARLRALIEPLLEWLEGDPGGKPRVHRSQVDELAATGLAWRGGEALRAQLEALRARSQNLKLPRGLKATLRPYQKDGFAWLGFLGEAGLGGILADDMGLGKTVQVLAHILDEKQRGRLADPALIVVPTSLVGNWEAEALRFTPTLKVVVLHGTDRAERYAAVVDHDLAITTYPLLARDRDRLVELRFSLLVLDEAQSIKNAASRTAHVVRALQAQRRLALTGTPLENHLGELWAEFDAVEPGLLGNQRQFGKFYRTPIEKRGDQERQQRLNHRIRPLLLRRRKDDVLTDLPPKTEIIHTLELEGDQRNLYETLRLAQHERVRQAVAERGLARSGIIVLDALLKLRQVCCDPRLVKLDSAKKVRTSVKLDAALELLDQLLDDGRRVLLFSQFTTMLGLIGAALARRGIAHQVLTGDTPARQRTALVQRFQQDKVPLFLISLKAGGLGLNLTAADAVVHYDPWWNPAVEAQATDRAHRIGQQKPVFVYRLICKGTVEEKIQALQVRKASLVRAVLEGGGASARLRFSDADLDALFAPM